MIRFLPLLFCAASAIAADIDWLSDEVVNKARGAVVTIKVTPLTASTGFFASADGLVVLAASALEGQTQVTVITETQETLKGSRLMALDPEHDLAVLATGVKAPAFLQVSQTSARAGDACTLMNSGKGGAQPVDAVLLSRRRALDWTEARFQELLVLATPPGRPGLTGAAVLTRDGRVAGMCDFVGGGAGIHTRIFALPEIAIARVLALARAATVPLPLPKKGTVLPHAAPDDDPDYNDGLVLNSRGESVAAAEKFRTCLTRHPGHPLVMGQLADATRIAGNLREAEKWLNEAIRIAPEKLLLHVQKGSLLSDKEVALRYFQDLTTRAPELPHGWGGTGMMQFNLGRPAEAAAAFRKWTELQPDSFEAWDAYARALSADSNEAEASRARESSDQLEDTLFKVRYTTPKRK